VNCTGFTDEALTVRCPREADWEIRVSDPKLDWEGPWAKVCQDHATDFIAVMGGPENTAGLIGHARTLDGTQDMTIHVTEGEETTEGWIERIRRHRGRLAWPHGQEEI
jgi:hypothetical protein